ncbi:cytoplasmic tRNA 2-thiolation protein 2 [Sabethes cyaneus]|uniref:cytoplasmic tRNA 2-thiolation protein 2 n=1 Tax=Sabethes cyaneus TaxID=53552 RepID=UPI00237E21FA|nr:cytoplasmic tRNA 2-thiolation protein 2 [Sabethes cyaneus]
MCSIGEDDFGDDGGLHAMQEDSATASGSSFAEGAMCQQCNQNQAVLKLRIKEPQCRSCFLHYARHKFRASLGSTKIVRRGSNVLVVFDGSRQNITMLDMIQYGLEQESFKKLRVNPVLLFVSEDFLSGNQDSYRKKIEAKLDLMKQFKYPSYIAVLGGRKCFQIDEEFLELLQSEGEKFVAVLSGIKSITEKQDFIEQTRKHTYKTMAKKLECGYVFLSDIGLNLAKTLLSNVALGRGRSLALDVAFCDDRDDQVKLIRPMRDLNPDEIENYVLFSENSLRFLDPEDPFKEKASLQSLTSKFVDGLQERFSATVSTVFRTGDKLAVPKNMAAGANDTEEEDLLGLFDKTLKIGETSAACLRCKFCHGELDFHDSDTLYATEFSRIVSSRINVTQSHEELVESTYLMEKDAHKAVVGELDQEDDIGPLKKELCHSCRNIFLDFEMK